MIMSKDLPRLWYEHVCSKLHRFERLSYADLNIENKIGEATRVFVDKLFYFVFRQVRVHVFREKSTVEVSEPAPEAKLVLLD